MPDPKTSRRSTSPEPGDNAAATGPGSGFTKSDRGRFCSLWVPVTRSCCDLVLVDELTEHVASFDQWWVFADGA